MKILLADAHSAIRQRLRQILLEELPYSQIEEVTHGDTLIARALTEDWDLIIADISMPVVSGLEALRHIRVRHPSLPFLLLSIYCEDEYAVHALKAGASAYLCKEQAHEKLAGAIQQLIV